MAGKYTGTNRQASPANTTDVCCLEAAGAEAALVSAFWAGSESTSAQTPFTIKCGRASGHAGALTTLTTIIRRDSHATVANAVAFGSGFATTQPTFDAGVYLDRTLQPYGGVISWRAYDLADMWPLVGPAHASNTNVLSCRPTTVGGGSAVLKAELTWQEIGG